MSIGTGIEWTDATWNPTTGCRKISPGCDNCYAAALAARLKAMGSPRYQRDGPDGPGFGLTLHSDKLLEPTRWRSPRFVFVNSMSDLFHSEVPAAFVESVFRTMAACPQHRFQVLTKRSQRMRSVVRSLPSQLRSLPNVWLGVSIENDEFVWRADHLRGTPAAVRFISAEPLLAPLPSLGLEGIDWLIVGGESGPHHRGISPDWVRDLRDRCAASEVAFFFKQWGGRYSKAGGRVLDGRTWNDYPDGSSSQPTPKSAAGAFRTRTTAAGR